MKHQAIAAVAAALAALPLAGCMQGPAASAAPESKAPAAVAVGQPVDCIQTNLIRDTKVWDDRTIDFVMRDKTRYRNTLPNSCPNLGFDQRFRYALSTNMLCNVDTITVLPVGSSIPGATCGLGRFVPVRLGG